MEEKNEHLSQVSIEEEQLPSVTPKPNLRIVDKETEEYEEERTEEFFKNECMYKANGFTPKIALIFRLKINNFY